MSNMYHPLFFMTFYNLGLDKAFPAFIKKKRNTTNVTVNSFSVSASSKYLALPATLKL